MKSVRFLIPGLIVIITLGCRERTDCHRILQKIENELNSGNLNQVHLLADSIRKECPSERELISCADSFSLIAERIPLDFSVTEEEVDKQLKERIGRFSPEEKADWEKKNWLESKSINGEKRYFNRAASNLRLIRNFHSARSYYDSVSSFEPDNIVQQLNTEAIIKESGYESVPIIPVEITLDYTLTIDPDAVPEGETIRCWLPYPRQNHSRQTGIRLISASTPDYFISPDSAIHRTIYMEARARKGASTVFNVSYSYRSSGQYFDRANLKILPYNRSSEIYRRYTAEQRPQICFTENVKHLADSIAGSESGPLETIRKIYYWFSNNIPWAGALEYSIIPNIPEYVISNRRGDCGMQTMLFMSMLRFKGIPVRWQSGWKMTPGGENLHDWWEVYLEGPGWIPVDISYGLQYSPVLKTREFFISGIDSYRLIINDGISGILFPEKKFLRSEPFDFQRGEVEWSGGNIYFDKWNYDMKISYK